MKYIIGKIDIDWSDNRYENKGGRGLEPKKKKGWIGLFDRNIKKFIWFKIIKKCMDKYAYICERKSKVIGYWSDLKVIN